MNNFLRLIKNIIDQEEDRIGSGLKSMVQVHPGHLFVGADVDSQVRLHIEPTAYYLIQYNIFWRYVDASRLYVDWVPLLLERWRSNHIIKVDSTLIEWKASWFVERWPSLFSRVKTEEKTLNIVVTDKTTESLTGTMARSVVRRRKCFHEQTWVLPSSESGNFDDWRPHFITIGRLKERGER